MSEGLCNQTYPLILIEDGNFSSVSTFWKQTPVLNPANWGVPSYLSFVGLEEEGKF